MDVHCFTVNGKSYDLLTDDIELLVVELAVELNVGVGDVFVDGVRAVLKYPFKELSCHAINPLLLSEPTLARYVSILLFRNKPVTPYGYLAADALDADLNIPALGLSASCTKQNFINTTNL